MLFIFDLVFLNDHINASEDILYSEQIPDTVLYYDTIFTYEIVYDTVFYYDTVYIEEYEMMPAKYADSLEKQFLKPLTDNNFLIRGQDTSLLFKNNKWSIDIFTSRFTSNYNFNTNDLSKESLLDLRNSSFTPKPGYNLGLNLNYHISRNLFLQSGFTFNWYNEDLDFFSKSTITDTIIIPEYTYNDYTTIDTVYFLDVDALVAGDTVWIPYYDTIVIQNLDTIYSEAYQSRDSINQRKGNHHWQYVEIPLIAAYNFEWGTLSISPKTGIITGFLYGYERYEIYSDNSIFISEIQEKKELQSINLSAYLSMAFEYQYNTHWSVIGEPWIRIPLLNFSESEGIILRLRTQGIKAGVRYYF